MKLNKEQYLAAHHVDGPMLVLAGPGSGKTHLLVERIRIMIEEKGIPPENILTITFSRKAARQMQTRFERAVSGNSYPVTFGTFHAVFYNILKDHDHDTGPLITEEQQRIFAERSIGKAGFHTEVIPGDLMTDMIISMISAYKNIKEEIFEKNEYAKRFDETERDGLINVFAEYERQCREARVVDFDDMILRCYRLLNKHESVLKKWSKKYRYILVDEFQDINEAQYMILRLLAGDHANIFAVGDIAANSVLSLRLWGVCPESLSASVSAISKVLADHPISAINPALKRIRRLYAPYLLTIRSNR